MSESSRFRSLVNRRQFLKRSAGLAAGAAAFPYIIPSSALGADGAVAPGNRLTLGVIGCGSQGTGNMKNFLVQRDVHVVAVCDVDSRHRDNARDLVNRRYQNSDCAAYNDFRDLLARTDLDIVSIAVPDHWHSIPAIAAARAGLDIYAEKPLSLTIREGRAMCDAVHNYSRVWQTGSWQRSQAQFRQACEIVRNGGIGKVHTVKVGLPSGGTCPPQAEMPIPDGFDYDMWLGPAPWAPYTKERCHWNFRWILDYSGGQLTDWAAHHCDIANWGMGTEYTGPVEVEGKGEYPKDGLWNTAVSYHFYCKYAAGASPVAPDGFVMDVANTNRGGALFQGTDGWVWVDRGGIEAEPKSLLLEKLGSTDIHLYKSADHMGNFLECVRSRALTITPIEVAHRAITIAHLGNIAMRLGRKIKWDPVKEEITGDAEASRMLMRTMRGEWHI